MIALLVISVSLNICFVLLFFIVRFKSRQPEKTFFLVLTYEHHEGGEQKITQFCAAYPKKLSGLQMFEEVKNKLPSPNHKLMSLIGYE